jgi:hypothetical protein
MQKLMRVLKYLGLRICSDTAFKPIISADEGYASYWTWT